jgi:rubredoxin
VAILKWYYNYRAGITKTTAMAAAPKPLVEKKAEEYVFQCSSCQSVYDTVIGDPANNIPAGTAFEKLSADYICPVCEAGKENFRKIKKSELGL